MTDEALDAAGTLAAAWLARWAAAPRSVALIDPAGVRLTADDLREASGRRAATLHASGIVPGATVLMSASPSLELVVTYVALMRLGVRIVPANTAYTEPELEYIVGDAAPVAAIVDDARRGPVLSRCGVELVLSPRPDLPLAPLQRRLLPDVDPESVAYVAYTSGTTGAPKGAMLRHRHLLAGAEAVRRAWAWSPHDRLVLALPLFHMHGLGVGLNGTLLAGASAVVLPSFGVDPVLDAVAAHEATMFFGVPTMYSRLSASPRAAELASLRLMVSGSAPLPPAVWHRMASVTGHQVLERYGMTETVMLASNPLDGVRKPGSVGLPLTGVELRLGADAEVEVKGPSVFDGYLGLPEATARSFTDDGWFRTGDVGSFDDDGYLSLVGRASDLIISGGYNVYPREIEDVLRQHPLVREVAVTGTPDEEWGEIVTGYVVLDESASAYSSWRATLGAHAVERLAPFKVPRIWYRVAELPRNAMGKVVRSELTPP